MGGCGEKRETYSEVCEEDPAAALELPLGRVEDVLNVVDAPDVDLVLERGGRARGAERGAVERHCGPVAVMRVRCVIVIVIVLQGLRVCGGYM